VRKSKEKRDPSAAQGRSAIKEKKDRLRLCKEHVPLERKGAGEGRGSICIGDDREKREGKKNKKKEPQRLLS